MKGDEKSSQENKRPQLELGR